MSRDARGVILGFVAVLLLRLSLTDDYLLYVKSSMRPWLIVSGVLLAVLAVVDWLGLLHRPEPEHHEDATGAADDAADDHTGHRHGLLPWVLLTPVVVVFAIGPSPLGAFMAERQATDQRVAASALGNVELAPNEVSAFAFPPLDDPVRGAVDVPLADFVSRAAYDRERSMDGVLIRLEGLTSSDADGPGDTFRLTRFVLSCCAADGQPVSIRAQGLDPLPEPDTWMRIEGYWVPHAGDEPPDIDEFEVVSAEEIPAPADPYL